VTDLAPRSVIVGLGANVGDRFGHLEAAVSALHDASGVRVAAVSRVYETAPLGPPQPLFLNAAARLETALPLLDLLHLTRSIEDARGRERIERWGPRTLDIDILWAAEETVALPDLVVPHPGLFDRAFALAPVLDVLPSPEPLFVESLAALGGAPPLHRGTLPVPK